MYTIAISDNLHKAVINGIPRTLGRGKHHARNAVHSLERAWQIRRIDPEGAVFRTLHAEEEAAAALFHGLRFKQYRHSEHLNFRRHEHKAALQPYFNAVVNTFRNTRLQGVKISPYWNPSDKGHGLWLHIVTTDPDGTEQSYTVHEPLSFTSALEGKKDDFRAEFQELITSDSNVSTIIEYVRDLANERNRALYATDNGIPLFTGDVDECVVHGRNRTFRVLLIFVIVTLEARKQPFMEQALEGFLRVLNLIPETHES